jgi:hypothetical protein
MGAPQQEGQLLVAGTPVSGYADLRECLLDPDGSGVEIDLSASGQALSFWGSLLRPYNGGGLYLSAEAVDDNTVLFRFRLPILPVLTSGFYPVGVRVLMVNGSLAATTGEFGLQLIQLLPALP